VPYDPEPEARRHQSILDELMDVRIAKRRSDQPIIALPVPPPSDFGIGDYRTSRQRHRNFDLLAGIRSCGRRADNILSPHALRILLRHCGEDDCRWVGSVRRFRDIANSFAVHASDLTSRSRAGLVGVQVRFSDIMFVHAQLLAVRGFLFRWLTDGDIGAPSATSGKPWAHFDLSGFSDLERRRLWAIGRGLDGCYTNRRNAARQSG
jgi:hypothetical protein